MDFLPQDTLLTFRIGLTFSAAFKTENGQWQHNHMKVIEIVPETTVIIYEQIIRDYQYFYVCCNGNDFFLLEANMVRKSPQLFIPVYV